MLYDYNAYGLLTEQTDANNNITLVTFQLGLIFNYEYDDNGTVNSEAEQNFDPLGRKCFPQEWRYENIQPGNEDGNQTTGHVRIGNPFINIKYENDGKMGPLGDDGDRFRTAALQINVGSFNIGFNLVTGDPGLRGRHRKTRIIDDVETYIENNHGDNPDKYRAGLGYIGIGPLRFGNDSERRRHLIQNELVHSRIPDSHYFRDMKTPNKFYFQFGTGGGFLW